MNRFWEQFNFADFDPNKVTFTHHFGHNKNFPEKMGSSTFICLLNPDVIQKIRNTYWPNPEKIVLQTDGQTDGRKTD